MRTALLTLLAAAALSGCTGSRVALRSYTVLDAAFAEETVRQCSRETPTIEGGWNPSEADVRLLERHLPALLDLTSSACCSPGARIAELDASHRQYVGVVVRGRRMIYVNAFPVAHREEAHAPVVVCDGGTAFWGALFDPETATFSDLAFNGEG
jgi:hypothetical protein